MIETISGDKLSNPDLHSADNGTAQLKRDGAALDNLDQAEEHERAGQSEEYERASVSSSGSFHSTVESMEHEVHTNDGGLMTRSLPLLTFNFGAITHLAQLLHVWSQQYLWSHGSTTLKPFLLVRSSDANIDLSTLYGVSLCGVANVHDRCRKMYFCLTWVSWPDACGGL